MKPAALVVLLLTTVGHAAEPGLTVTPIARDGTVLVTFELSDGLTRDVRDEIHSGLPTTFAYDVELRRGTPGWFDRTIAATRIAASVRFDNLTRRYQLWRAVDGRVSTAHPSDDEHTVRLWMTRFDQVPVSTTSALEMNGEYYVRVRAGAPSRNTWFPLLWNDRTMFGHAKFTFLP